MRYKISIEYNGTKFSGWQKQPNAITIQGTIEKALKSIVSKDIEVVGSGRTDSGVHAIEQVAHFDINKHFEDFRLQEALNFYLKNTGISVFNVENLGKSNFHSRFDAIERSYIYKILQRNYPPTFQKNLYWWITKSLDIEKMQKASKILIGKHDFSSFRATGCQAKSPIKTINAINIWQNRDIINIEVYAPSFLYNQVRNIVGSLYFVGVGKWQINDFQTAFLAKNRTKAAICAPACGLYLKKITY